MFTINITITLKKIRVKAERTYGGLCHSSYDINRPNLQYNEISNRSSCWPDQPMKLLVTIAHCPGYESGTSYKTKRNVKIAAV